VYTICISVLKVKEEAEEATQDTLIKVLKAAPNYVKKGKLSTWIYPIAYRTSLDYLKKSKRNVLATSSELLENVSSADIESGEDEKQNRSAQILKVIEQLKPEEAGLIRMFYFDQLSISELSAHLNQTESNIKVKLYRARKRIMDHLNK